MSARKNRKIVAHAGCTLRQIKPITDAQKDVFDAWDDDYHLVLHGVAGTGKTFLSLYLGLRDVFAEKYQRVVIIRSVVPSREIGHLPGTTEEKAATYETPYRAICKDLFGRKDAYDLLKEKGIIEFETTSFNRGVTFDECCLVVDEFQNMNFSELDTIITRAGKNCRVVFSGDIEQADLRRANDRSGLPEFLQILETMDEFDQIEFDVDDIVRSGLVKSYLLAKRKLKLQ